MTDGDRKDFITLFREAEMSGGSGRGFYGIKQGLFKTMKGIKKSKRILLKAFENNKSIVYHTRFATQGKVKLENNHPFSVFGKKHNLVGVHNGNLYKDYSYSIKDVEARGDKTDSQLFYEYLADNGIEKAVNRYYSDGWGAFIWYDLDVRKWYAIKFEGNLEGSKTDFGLVIATKNLWNKFDSGYDIDLDDLTLYELCSTGVKPIRVFKAIKEYNFQKFGEDRNNEYRGNEYRKYGYYDGNNKWVWDNDPTPLIGYGDEGKMSSYEAGKKIRKRLEREVEQERILDEIDEDISLADEVKEKLKESGLTFVCVGGRVFVKDKETGEIKEEVIDRDSNVHLLPIPSS